MRTRVLAPTLASYVARVRHTTGATKVDLVGHSQGGIVAEYFAKVLGGAASIHDLIGLSPTTHGTTLDGVTSLASFFPGANSLVGAACQACVDQETGSPVIAALDDGPIAQAGVTNEYVQSSCPFDAVDHVDLPYDRTVIQLTENALDPATAKSPNCLEAFPYPA